MATTLEAPAVVDPPADPAGRAPRAGRLVGIDIARAVALLGMFTQHVGLDGDGGLSTGWVAFAFRESAGRASVLFFVLSGVSLSIIADRGSASAAPGALYRRGFLLLTGGLLLTSSIWSASILQHYGLAFLAAPLLLRLGRRGLLIVTGAGLVGGPVLLLFGRNWTGEVVGLLDGGSGRWLLENLWDIAVSGLYPMVLWIGFFTLGMVIGRLDLANRRNLLRLAGAGVVLVLLAGSAANQLTDRYGSPDFGFGEEFENGSGDTAVGSDDDVFDDASLWKEKPDGTLVFTGDDADLADLQDEFGSVGFDDGFAEDVFDVEIPADGRALLDVTGHSGGMGWTLQTGAMAVAALAGALLLPRAVTRPLAPLAWMGSMSLTAYLVHIVLVTDVMTPHVEPASWSILTKELIFASMLVALVATCSIFHVLLRVGPMEWLLKQFTVGPQRPPA